MSTIDLKNPNNLRVANQLRVIEALRNKPETCPALAKALSLSGVAIKHITDELLKENIIVSYGIKSPKNRGRKATLLSLNNDVGVLCAIDLSGRDLAVAITDVSNNIIVEDAARNILYIDDEALEKVAQIVKNLLSSPLVKKRKLLGICVSTPGEFDNVTYDFIYAPRYVGTINNIKRFFEDRFQVEVNIYNDINLGLLGEQRYGSIPNSANDVYFVFLDYVAGSSLLLNGKIFEGARGHAGEPASYPKDSEFTKNLFSGRFYTINDIYAYIHEHAKDYPNEPFYLTDPFSFEQIATKYKEGDPLISEAIEYSAKINAIQLIAVSNLLDLEYICLEGKMLELGATYTDLIIHYFRKYDANHTRAQILFSSLDSAANMLGAIYQASNMYFLNLFAMLAAKRTNSSDHDIKTFFGNNI